jgi:hypothetical protein
MGTGWADYDNDGDLDLYVANYDAANVMLENQGGDVFVDATTPVLKITAASVGVAWGDYDNDGDLDLYVTNEGPNVLLRNDGGVFTDVTASPLNDGGNGRSAAWGDYNLDGNLDLYVVNYDSPNTLLRNEGAGVFVIPECAVDPIADDGKGFSMGWGDYDKDGDLDMYVVNDGRNGLYRNDIYFDRHWLEVCLVGESSNACGQGARVRIVSGDASQMREIAGASGYLSQGPLTAFFGLDAATTVDTLEVTWPVGGVTQVLTGVVCDQTVTIFESDLAGTAHGDLKPKALRLYPCRPNPFSSMTSMRYDLPEASHVDLEIYDVSGRMVRRFIDHHPTEPGRHTATWNGRNEKGQHVGPGIYFCRLEAGSGTQIQRIVLLR